MHWDDSYVVPQSVTLRISPSGTFVATTSTAQERELTDDALPLLTAFASPTTPREALVKLKESWEIDDGSFVTLVDALIGQNLLKIGRAHV